MRNREPQPSPGELKACWGKLEHEDPGIILVNGDGVPSADRNYLQSILCGPRGYPDGICGNHLIYKEGMSFVKELERRGYDLTTMKFSVKKRS